MIVIQDGFTALMWACSRSSKSTVKLLLEAGADQRIVCIHTGETALSLAKTAEIQQLLEEYGKLCFAFSLYYIHVYFLYITQQK